MQIRNEDLAGLVGLSDTLLLIRFGGPGFTGPPVASIKEAIIATGGRTLFVHAYQGLVEVPDLYRNRSEMKQRVRKHCWKNPTKISMIQTHTMNGNGSLEID